MYYIESFVYLYKKIKSHSTIMNCKSWIITRQKVSKVPKSSFAPACLYN